MDWVTMPATDVALKRAENVINIHTMYDRNNSVSGMIDLIQSHRPLYCFSRSRDLCFFALFFCPFFHLCIASVIQRYRSLSFADDTRYYTLNGC